ncbi:MAG: flagellar protein, partial [Verrucomicrobiales bacterium VVV1]
NNTVSITLDQTPPTIAITSDKSTLKAGETATITFTLSEDSTDFTSADVAVNTGTLSNFTGSGKAYTATFTPTAGTTATGEISVASDKFTDAFGNLNKDGAEANNNFTISSDTAAPSIAVSSDKTTLKAGETATISFTLTKPSTDFTSADVTVQGGTLSNFSGTGKDYTATFTPTPGSTANSVISVASNKFSDSAGNFNQDGSEANNLVTMTTDTALPTIAVTSDKTALKAGETANITFKISESVTDFVEADVVVTGGTLSNFQGSGTTYTAVFTPNTNSSVAAGVSVASSKFTDAAGNQNADGGDANNAVSMTVDTAVPTIAISSNKTFLKAGDTATISFTLSESVSDFIASDVTVSGGTLSNFSGSGTSYTATFTPTAGSTADSVVSVASNKFSDPNGNFNQDGSEANNKVTMPTAAKPPTLAITGDTA